MASCEKCWSDSYRMTYGTGEDRVDKYTELIKERNCTPEEQAGSTSGICPKCERKTIHQIISVCMNCGFDIKS